MPRFPELLNREQVLTGQDRAGCYHISSCSARTIACANAIDIGASDTRHLLQCLIAPQLGFERQQADTVCVFEVGFEMERIAHAAHTEVEDLFRSQTVRGELRGGNRSVRHRLQRGNLVLGHLLQTHVKCTRHRRHRLASVRTCRFVSIAPPDSECAPWRRGHEAD
jgi:hypothetical protein